MMSYKFLKAYTKAGWSKDLTWCEARVTAQNRVRWQELVEDLCSSGTKRTNDDEL